MLAEKAPIRVFLLDDYELVRRGIRHLIEDQPDMTVVGEAEAAAHAVEQIAELEPDIALLDVTLPTSSGIEVCRAVRERGVPTRCVMLTSFEDEATVAASMIAGATGYLLKRIRGDSLLASVRTAAAGLPVFDSGSVTRVMAQLRGTATDGARSELAALTGTQRQILELIADGLTNRQIGARLFLAEKTVKNHVTAILAKLGLSSRTQAAVLVHRQR